MPQMEMENVKTQRAPEEREVVDLKYVAEAALCSFRDYARSNPETVALWCIGIGFVLGWKLKPW